MTHNDMLFFWTASFLLILTPGPDMLYIIGRSVSQGRLAGLVSALGIGVGCMGHIIAVSLGLTALLKAVPLAFEIMRYTGACYLLYLGIKMLRRSGKPSEKVVVERTPLIEIFKQGMITNLLNPKVALFFVAFLPQFVDPASNTVALQLAGLGILFDISGTAVNVLVAYTASYAGDKLKQKMRSSGLLNKCTALIMIALGLRLALERKK